MADKSVSKAASAEQKIGYIGLRLREKSTYGGLSVAVGLVLPFLIKFDPALANSGVDTIVTGLSYAGMAIGIFIGVFLPENGSPDSASAAASDRGSIESVRSLLLPLVLALTLLALWSLPGYAQAASLPPVITKTAPSPLTSIGQPYPTKGCGFYYGIDAEGGAGGVSGAPAGTTVIGGDIGGLIGYACPMAGLPFFFEALADFQNLNATGSDGFSLTGPGHLEQRFGIQTPLLAFLPSLGAPSTGTVPSIQPMLPPGVAINGSAQNYVYVAANEDDISSQFGLATARAWLFSPEVGTGMLIPLKTSNGTPIVADAFAGAELQSDAVCVGGIIVCPKLATRFKTGVSFKY